MSEQLEIFPKEPQTFKYYLHDDYNSHEIREWLESEKGGGLQLSDAAWERLAGSFYEVTLECEVDEKGHVTLLGATL